MTTLTYTIALAVNKDNFTELTLKSLSLFPFCFVLEMVGHQLAFQTINTRNQLAFQHANTRELVQL